MGDQTERIAQMSLQHAVDEHKPLREVTKLRTRGKTTDLMREKQLIAASSPAMVDSLNFEDHPQASHTLWAIDPPYSGLEYAGDQFTAVAVIIAAELKVPRQYDADWIAKHVVRFLIAANSQLTGYW